MSNPVKKAADAYIEMGWHVFPLQERGKGPGGVKWKEFKATLENSTTCFPEGKNIGVALGAASGGLVDLDFDQQEAAQIGEKIFSDLPGFGRKSALNGHRVAYCANPEKTKQYSLSKEEATALGMDAEDKAMVLEVRSSGGYTMFPPSTHPSGEVVEWVQGIPSQLPSIAWDTLVKRAGVCAALAVILRAYPAQRGQRDEICMALAGTLLRAGLPPSKVDELIVHLARCKGDEEADKRCKAEATAGKMGESENVTGLTRLCELLGIEKLTPKLHKWLYGEAMAKDPQDRVAQLNEKFFVVGSEGGKCRVAYFEERFFERNQMRKVLVVQSFQDFRNRFMNEKVEVSNRDGMPSFKKLGDVYLESPERRQYDRIEFLPGYQAPPDVLNLWQGFAYEARKGSWRHMQRHVWQVLARRDRETFRYIVRWAAWAVQNPGEPAQVALVFRGGKGTGKGTFCRWVKYLFGQHGLQIFSSRHISGRFNGHLRDCVLLFADEAIAPNDKEAESILKGMLTEPSIPIEGKGRDVIQAPNHLHVLMASNAEWVVPASGDERRFAIFDASNERVNQRAWFDNINREMESGGANALLYFLLNLDLGDWKPAGNIPDNPALNDQRINSLSGPDELWFSYLFSGGALGEVRGTRLFIPTKEFAKEARINQTAAALYLKTMGGLQDRSGRPSGWLMPSLQEARERWNKVRFVYGWDDNDSVWVADRYQDYPF